MTGPEALSLPQLRITVIADVPDEPGQECIIRAKTNSGSGPIRTPFRFIPNKLPAESERGQ